MMQGLMQNFEKKLKDQSLVVKKVINKLISLKRQKEQGNSRPSQSQLQALPYNTRPSFQIQASYNQNRPINNSLATNINANL